MSNQLAKVSDATKALGVTSPLPANKAITVSELESLIFQIPKLNAVTSESYHRMINNLIAATSTSVDYRLAFVENLNGKKCTVRSSYGEIKLEEGIYGGWYSIPNASGWDSVNVDVPSDGVQVSLQVTFMKKTGAFAYTKVNQKSTTINPGGYGSVYEDTYALSGGGHIFYVLIY